MTRPPGVQRRLERELRRVDERQAERHSLAERAGVSPAEYESVQDGLAGALIGWVSTDCPDCGDALATFYAAWACPSCWSSGDTYDLAAERWGLSVEWQFGEVHRRLRDLKVYADDWLERDRAGEGRAA